MKKVITMVALLAMTVTAFGQEEKLKIDAGADVVSSYVWRGMYGAGASFQPTLSLSTGGLTLEAWGSTDLSASYKEIDFSLSYEIGGFSVILTDYWWDGEGASYFGKNKSLKGDGHYIEAGLGFTFSDKFPLTLGVNTMLAGDGDRKIILDEEGEFDRYGDQLYSTYITASYPFSVKEVDCELGVGVSPAKGMYSDKFDVAAISAKASKNLQLSDKFALPVFVELIFSPARDNAFFVFGLTF